MAYTQCSQINAGINARCDTSMGGIIEVAIANYDPAIFTFLKMRCLRMLRLLLSGMDSDSVKAPAR